MDARMLSALVLTVVCARVALYFVIRAAVRDGISLASAKETARDLSRAAGKDSD